MAADQLNGLQKLTCPCDAGACSSWGSVPGQDVDPGNNLDTRAAATAKACVDICAVTAGCLSAIFDATPQICYLKALGPENAVPGNPAHLLVYCLDMPPSPPAPPPAPPPGTANNPRW